jgi:hypothetical protein
MKYFSQLDETVPEDKQRNICGAVCVKMILDYKNPESEIDINDLIKEGEMIVAFDIETGGLWSHEGLVRLLRNHGESCYPQEFRSVFANLETGQFETSDHEEELMQRGIEKIMRFVKRKKPVIASFKTGFTENTKSHLVVIKDIKTNEKSNSPVFIINDPVAGENIEISIDHFLKYWKKMAIFVN